MCTLFHAVRCYPSHPLRQCGTVTFERPAHVLLTSSEAQSARRLRPAPISCPLSMRLCLHDSSSNSSASFAQASARCGVRSRSRMRAWRRRCSASLQVCVCVCGSILSNSQAFLFHLCFLPGIARDLSAFLCCLRTLTQLFSVSGQVVHSCILILLIRTRNSDPPRPGDTHETHTGRNLDQVEEREFLKHCGEFEKLPMHFMRCVSVLLCRHRENYFENFGVWVTSTWRMSLT